MTEPGQFDGGERDQPEAAAVKFYSGALGRIRHFMLALGAAGTVAVWALYGWRVGLGFLAGCLVAWANFYWLEQAVEALAERITSSSAPGIDAEAGPARRESGSGIVMRFLLRYALIAAGAYVIFKSSVVSVWGFLGGLFLAVGAILCEAMYEAYMALRRGL